MTSLWAALALAALASSPAHARRALTPPAPEFPKGGVWLNSQPLSLKAERKRRAVLVAFINSANLNSLRALKALGTWERRYGKQGLLVVLVHTPDYDFQRNQGAVAKSLARHGVEFPILLDGDRRAWRSYENNGWPAFYLIDHLGRIVFDHLGEGGYAEFEKEIRDALDQIPGGAQPEDAEPFADAAREDCGAMSPEVAVGSARGRPTPLGEDGGRLTLLFPAQDGIAGHAGFWTQEPDALRLPQNNPEYNSYVSVVYRGAHAFGLMGTTARKGRFFVRQDGLWMHPGNAGKEVRFDEDGRSYVEAAEIRLHHLAKNADDAIHELTVAPAKAGARIYGFQFSDRCLAAHLP